MKYADHIILDAQNSRNLLTTKLWVRNYNKRLLVDDTKSYQHVSAGKLTKSIINEYSSIHINEPRFILNDPVKLYSYLNKEGNGQSVNSHMGSLFDINFLKKEHMYTKLKYSRCPQYDIVSGGVAALLAGFFGFLVGERFGLELLDSGDFYFALMYVVFFCLSSRLFFKIIDEHTPLTTIVRCGWLFTFYRDLFILLLRKFLPLVNLLPSAYYTFILYVKLTEYLTYVNYMFWRVIRFLRWWPLNKF